MPSSRHGHPRRHQAAPLGPRADGQRRRQDIRHLHRRKHPRNVPNRIRPRTVARRAFGHPHSRAHNNRHGARLRQPVARLEARSRARRRLRSRNRRRSLDGRPRQRMRPRKQLLLHQGSRQGHTGPRSPHPLPRRIATQLRGRQRPALPPLLLRKGLRGTRHHPRPRRPGHGHPVHRRRRIHYAPLPRSVIPQRRRGGRRDRPRSHPRRHRVPGPPARHPHNHLLPRTPEPSSSACPKASTAS